MSGYTDYAFRQILKKFKPDLMYFEMLNSNTFSIESRLLKKSLDEITGVQLFGSDLNKLFYQFETLHNAGYTNLLLNMGCPQPKILKSGCGANLLERFEEIKELISALNKKNIPISIKIRHSAYTDKYFDLANNLKLEFLCLHARTKEQLFKGKADWNLIEDLSKRERNFTFIANGDIHSLSDYNKIKHLNIDGIMLARGVVKRPQLIEEIRSNKLINIDLKETILNHLKLLKEDKGERKAAIEINKFLIEYLKDMNINIKEIILEKDYNKKISLIKDTKF